MDLFGAKPPPCCAAHARLVVRAAVKRQQPSRPPASSSAFRLNELTTSAMRAMLCGDHYAAKQSQYELDSAVRTLVANGDKAAARYVYVLYNMLEHKLVDEADTLEEQYQEALHRLWSLVEDSGWRLAREGEEENPEQQALTAQADLMIAPPSAEHLFDAS